MPRLSAVDPATDSGPGADLLNGPLKSKQINIFKGMAANPGVLKAFLGFMGGVKAGALTDAEHEVVALTCATHRTCDYCTAAHSVIAAGAGLTEDAILSIRRGTPEDDRHRALADFTRAVLDRDGHVTDAELAAVRDAGYGDDAIVEALAEITAMTFTRLFNHVHGTEIDFPEPAAI